jgi:hypothetical protein
MRSITAGFRTTIVLGGALAVLAVCSSDDSSGGGSGGSGTAMGTGGSGTSRAGTGGTGNTPGGSSGSGGSADNGGSSGSGGSPPGGGGAAGSAAAYAGVEAGPPRIPGREIAGLMAALTGGTSARWTGPRTESLYEALHAEQGWGVYRRLGQLLETDGLDWSRLDGPTSLARDHAVAYLSLAAGYDLTVRFNAAGVPADPEVVRAIISARSQAAPLP